MAYTITDQCITCNRCQPQSPTTAIANLNRTFSISPELLNPGSSDDNLPQCPLIQGSIPHSANYWDSWFVTYNRIITRLNGERPNRYW